MGKASNATHGETESGDRTIYKYDQAVWSLVRILSEMVNLVDVDIDGAEKES